MYMAASALSISYLHSFLHEDERATRVTTKPTLPVESVLLKRCVLSGEQITQLIQGQNNPISYSGQHRNESKVHSMFISHLDRVVISMCIQSGSSVDRP